MADALLVVKRDVRTFAELSYAADFLLRTALDYRPGNLYTAMSSILLRTFSFEAYLNHLGERHFRLWDPKERIGWRKKLAKIRERLSFSPDESVRPYSTLVLLFDFRNLMAHGRSETIEHEREIDSLDADKFVWPLTAWEAFCTPENVERAKVDVTSIILELHKLAGIADNPFAPPQAGGSVRLKAT